MDLLFIPISQFVAVQPTSKEVIPSNVPTVLVNVVTLILLSALEGSPKSFAFKVCAGVPNVDDVNVVPGSFLSSQGNASLIATIKLF